MVEDGESEAEGGSGSQRKQKKKQKRGQAWNLAKRVINTEIRFSRTLSRHRNKSPPWGWPFFRGDTVGGGSMWPVVFPAHTDVRLNTPRYALELDERSFAAPRNNGCFKT